MTDDDEWRPPPLAVSAGFQPTVSDPAVRVRRTRRRRRTLLLGAVLSLVVAVTLGALALVRYQAGKGPQAIAGRYFAALSDGDAARALAYAASPPASALLTSTVLAEQLKIAPLTDVEVGQAAVDGDTATVDVRYRLAFHDGKQDVTDRADLVKAGSSWRLARVASTVRLDADPFESRLAFAGRPLPAAGPTDFVIFPGALPLTTGAESVDITGHSAVRLADRTLELPIHLEVSATARSRLVSALGSTLTACLSAPSASGSNPLCPLPTSGRPVPGSMRGTLAAPLSADQTTIKLDASDPGHLDVDARVSVHGDWKEWDFNNQVVDKSGTATVRAYAQAAVTDPSKVVLAAPR